MTAADLDAVLAIEQACFSRGWSRRQFQDELCSERAVAVVAEQAGRVVGFLCLSVLLDEAEVLDIAVDPSVRRSGIGSRLLRWACDEALRRGAAVLRLEVRATSEPALRLYERFGFVQGGRRRGYYEEGIDAVLMDKQLHEEDACSSRP